jgi:NAD(P)-dependent dehydrogenase (short-subunit alcohol dehydrogenase family)
MLHRHMDHQTPEIVKQVEACHPLGVGTVHDVAAAVAFLASSEARWISGVTLPLGWMPSFALPGEPFSRAAVGGRKSEVGERTPEREKARKLEGVKE